MFTIAHGTQRVQDNAAEFSVYRARCSRRNQDSMPKGKQSQSVLRQQSINTINVPDDGFDPHQHMQHNDDKHDLMEEQVNQNRVRTDLYFNDNRNNMHSHNLFDEDNNQDLDEEGEENLANATNNLAGDVQTQLNRIDKQLRSLSKSVQDNTINPAITTYQNLSNTYSTVVPFNGINLLNVAKAADYKKYARTILQMLFTVDELSDSILIVNPIYNKPGLDSTRMAKWTDAVSARFKIDPVRFDDFFRTCLRRTLPQMLCDTRRKRKRLMKNVGAQRHSAPTSAQSDHGIVGLQSVVSGSPVMQAGQQVHNRNILH
ncbi:unnamed protein product [Rotaria sp. Silwood2]|nr:unnamed protein product [Rotaria sp. Silwood2]